MLGVKVVCGLMLCVACSPVVVARCWLVVVRWFGVRFFLNMFCLLLCLVASLLSPIIGLLLPFAC